MQPTAIQDNALIPTTLPNHETSAPRRVRCIIAGVWLTMTVALLFTRLGHYPFWPDEADTVLFAEGVWNTGDTTAILGHNIYAYRDGALLRGTHNRVTPPLPYYLAAPFWGAAGSNTFVMRIPFALAGLACAALAIAWLWRSGASTVMWLVIALGFIGNVSLFLFSRQCRYYAVAILATMAITGCYARFDGRWRTIGYMLAASLALLTTQYLNFVAVYAALIVDFALVGRQGVRPTRGQWAVLILPQVVVAALLAIYWNPLGAEALGPFPGRSALLDRLTLIGWHLRELNACQYGVGILMVTAPLLYAFVPSPWLWRAPLAIGMFAVVIALTTPQPVALGVAADVRYLAPLIPLCIFATAWCILALTCWSRRSAWLAVPLAAVAFGSTVLHHPFEPREWENSLPRFVNELAHPRETAISATLRWINEHAREGQTAFVAPLSYPDDLAFLRRQNPVDPNAYSLMAHAPQLIYGWQLTDPVPPALEGLPLVQYSGAVPTDYILAFGYRADEVARSVVEQWNLQGIPYDRLPPLNVYFNEGTRPELLPGWHLFEPPPFDPEVAGVFIYRMRDAPTRRLDR